MVAVVQSPEAGWFSLWKPRIALKMEVQVKLKAGVLVERECIFLTVIGVEAWWWVEEKKWGKINHKYRLSQKAQLWSNSYRGYLFEEWICCSVDKRQRMLTYHDERASRWGPSSTPFKNSHVAQLFKNHCLLKCSIYYLQMFRSLNVMTLDLWYFFDSFNKNSYNYTILYTTLKSTMLLILTNTIFSTYRWVFEV